MFNKNKITSIEAREILDSRGNPTVEVTMSTPKHSAGAAVPSGASTGIYEALELRDGNQERFGGKGVLKAVENINKIIAPALKGMDPLNQRAIDDKLLELDGTENKAKLGANAMLGVSLAASRLAAEVSGKPLFEYLKTLADIKTSRTLPFLCSNVINGGLHAVTPLPFQEYVVLPQTDDLEEALNIIHKIQNELKETLGANIGDEGGFVPNTSDPEEPLKALKQAAATTGTLDKVKFAMDVAATSFYKDGKYQLQGHGLDADGLLEVYKNMAAKYPLLYIEDPFHEEDFASFAKLNAEIPELHVVGDDLTVTNTKRLQEAINKKSISAIIIKPNQIGTLSETLDTMKLARDNDIECIVSHRSGETNDAFIVDLAAAFGAFGIKAGALQRGERVAKYNRFLEIYKNG